MTRTFALLLITAVLSSAQNPGEPFTLIRLLRRPTGPTADPAVIQMHRNARVPVDVLGLHSITGLQQAWLVEAHGSFASIEATDRALASVPMHATPELASPATLVGLLRPGLSYRPADAIKLLSGARYFYVTFFQTRPGAAGDFAEVMRLRNASLDRVNVDRPELGYQIISGGEAGTYVFLAPMASLAVMDEAIARIWGHAESAPRPNTGDIIREQLLFRVEPKLSYVSETFAGNASEFWNAK